MLRRRNVQPVEVVSTTKMVQGSTEVAEAWVPEVVRMLVRFGVDMQTVTQTQMDNRVLVSWQMPKSDVGWWKRMEKKRPHWKE